MRLIKTILCFMLLLAYFNVSTFAKKNSKLNRLLSKNDDHGGKKNVVRCVTEYVISGDLELDDDTFCNSNSSCGNNSNSSSGSGNAVGPSGNVGVVGDYCDNYYDITLIVEESSFIQKNYWIHGAIPFLESMVRNARVSKDKAHMSVILFAEKQRVIVPFTDELSQDKEKLIEKIKKIDDVATNSKTLYVYALEYAMEHIIFGDGTRKDAPKVAVLFYYGFDYGANKSLIPDVVEDYKTRNIKLIIVGIALGDVNNAYLLADCTIGDVNCANVIFKPWDFVIAAAEQVKEKICNKNKSSYNTPLVVPDSLIK